MRRRDAAWAQPFPAFFRALLRVVRRDGAVFRPADAVRLLALRRADPLRRLPERPAREAFGALRRSGDCGSGI